MRTFLTLLLMAGTSLIVVTTLEPTAPPPQLLGTSWTLVTFSAADSMAGPVPAGRYRLVFEDAASVVGQSDCNVVYARYHTQGPDALAFTALEATRATCADGSHDPGFRDALSQVTHYVQQGPVLRLYYGDGHHLVFQEQPTR